MDDNIIDAVCKRYFDDPTTQSFSKYFNTRWILVTDTASSRVLNHWEKMGLIDDPRNNNRGWRKYSVVEAVWLQIIEVLRTFNLPLKNIRRLKEQLECASVQDKDSRMPLLQMAIFQCIAIREPLKLLVYPTSKPVITGKSIPFNLNDPDDLKGNFIHIDLSALINSIFPDKVGEDQYEVSDLNDSEKNLLVMIRTGLFKEFKMETRDGKIKRVEATELIKDKKLFHQIANEYPYQEISSSIKDGKIVSMKRTIKKKY